MSEPPKIMDTEPVRAISGVAAAFVGLLSAFVVTLTPEQKSALGTYLPILMVALMPVGVALCEFIRAKVFSPATVSKLQANPPPFPTPSPDTAPPVATTDETLNPTL